MNASTLACPYCNALLAEAEVQSTRHRALCPRCGETFPLPTGPHPDNSLGLPLARQDDPAHSPLTTHRSPFSNRTVALFLLSFMGLVAGIFLWYAWETQHIRREHDSQLPKGQSITVPIGIAIACNVYIVALIFTILKPRNRPGALRMTILLAGLTAVAVTIGLLRVHIRVSSDPNAAEDVPARPIARITRPAELSGLGFLPNDTNVIAAIHVAQLMETPAGREFLAGRDAKLYQQLRSWAGLDSADIDHVIVGLKVDDNLIPRVVAIFETTHPLVVSQVREKLKAGRLPDPQAVRFASDHTMILALTRKDLESVPSESGGHLAPQLQEALQERTARGAAICAVGSSDHWEKTVALTYLAAWPEATRQVLGKVQTFAVSLRVDAGVVLNVAFQCTDESAAQALADFFRHEKPDNLQEMTISQKDAWVSLQAKTSDLASIIAKLQVANPKL
jgi:hypothetical protein